MRKKVGVGRLGLPLWSVGLAGALILAAAGQAVGPILSGAVSGAIGAAVSQSLVLTPDSYAYAAGGSNDALLTINDEGAHFTVAMELNVGGQDNLIALNIDNLSEADASALLVLDVPAGIDVEVSESFGTDVQEGQQSRNSWLLSLTTDSANEDLEITVHPSDSIKPGFYTITGRLSQVEG
jgi:hypothetical protein